MLVVLIVELDLMFASKKNLDIYIEKDFRDIVVND